MQIQDAIALVTGANRGIGKALVHTLLEQGATKVYATARNPESLAGFRDEARVVAVPLDVTDGASVAALAERAVDVRLLINNAGVLDFGPVLEAPRAAFERNFATNFYGLLEMAAAFAPILERNGGGAMANLLTLVSLASMPSIGVYTASKAAAWSLTQSLRAGLGRRGIMVHAVFPGATDTDMIAALDGPKARTTDVARAIVEGIEASVEDIFPDPAFAALYEAWKTDHKAVERQFASL